MRPRSLTHLVKLISLSVVALSLMLALVSPVWAGENDNDVEWYGTGHYPAFTVCGDSTYPYRTPVNPRADQSVAILARSYYQDLTGVTVWYTTSAGATEPEQWLPVTANWIANWWDCTGEPDWDMDIWRAVIPAQASRVWYKIAYTDGTDTDWRRAAGESSNGMYDDDGGWTTGSTTLTYEPPTVVAVDDDFNTGTTGWDYDHFSSVQSGVSAVAAGGTVNVYSGSYADNIVINKSLTLDGWDSADTILIRPAISNPNCGGAGGGSLCAGGSNIILVQADNVTIHNLTLDGDNPTLTSGIVRNGADLDARNGIIENHAVGVFNNLTVYDTTIRNIYLRGLYASSGGDNFNLHHNTVQNVQGDSASVAIMNFGGSGRIANNTVVSASDAINANWSRGTYIQFNTITASGSGVHTDNNGGLGGNADVLERNIVSNCTTGGYGVWVFAPYRDVSVEYNTIISCAVGLAVAGQNAPATPSFFDNEVDGQSLPDSTGIYVTTDMFGWGSNNVSASFDSNAIANTVTGIYVEQSLITRTLHATFTNSSLVTNTIGLEMTGGNVTFAGNNVDVGTTAVTQSGGALLAYANNFTDYTMPLTRTGGTSNVAHNWWGTYVDQPASVSSADWQRRLGAPLVQLGGYVVWATGNGSAALDGAELSGGTGTAVIVNHGHTNLDAPFGNVLYNDMCSGYYDFFTVNGSGTWNVSVPVDASLECTTQTLDPGKLFWIPPGTDYAAGCIAPNNGNPACWDLITPTLVITGGQNITVTGLSAIDLGGTQFVAGSATGSDPTAVTIVGLAATTDRSAAPAGIILAGAVIAATSIVLVTRHRR